MAMMTPDPLAPSVGEPEPRRRPHLYRRAPDPVYFPASEEVPETNHHLERRNALYLSLKRERSGSATIGSDQFVYYDPTTAKRRLAPDVFVRLGAPHRPFRIWKVWERGAPDLGVEIVSDADEGELDWNEKLARYRAAGVGEVVRFDAQDTSCPIRVWDRVDGDLVERSEEDPELRFCEALRLWWTVVDDPEVGAMLRLARDRDGRDLLPTPDEDAAMARQAEAEARQAEAEARKQNERLQAELAAVKARLEPKPRKRRT
jgi:Uma2 family endonuclease